jgi:hypothetical protein
MSSLTAIVVLCVAAGETRADGLKIHDLEAAHGRYGPKRESLDVYPGEEVLFRYEVTGASVDARGRIAVVLEERVTDENGAAVLQARDEQRSILALGGGAFTGNAMLMFPDGAKPGTYKLAVSITDTITGESAVAESILTLKPVEFALVMPRFSYDAAGEIPAPAAGLVGQTLHVSVKALGLDASKDKIDAEMQLQIFDAADKPTLRQPIVVNFVQDDPKVARAIGMVRFKAEIVLNRVGDFTVRINVKDRMADKAATFSSPLAVSAP